MDCFWATSCSNSSGWSFWGRWVLIVCVAVALAFLVCLLIYHLSRKRLHQGRAPIAGTGWIVQSAERTRSSRRHQEPEADPVPPYMQSIGDHDAGYYDPNGNFIAKGLPAYESVQPPPKAVVRTRTEEVELDTVDLERPNQSPV